MMDQARTEAKKAEKDLAMQAVTGLKLDLGGGDAGTVPTAGSIGSERSALRTELTSSAGFMPTRVLNTSQTGMSFSAAPPPTILAADTSAWDAADFAFGHVPTAPPPAEFC